MFYNFHYGAQGSVKKYILALSIGLFSCVPSKHEVGTTPIPEKYSEYCRAVEDRLKLRRCEVGYDFVDGTTFETFCKNLIFHGVDINPLCLMEIRDCDQIDVCTGSIHDRKKDKLSSIGVDSKVVLDQVDDPSCQSATIAHAIEYALVKNNIIINTGVPRISLLFLWYNTRVMNNRENNPNAGGFIPNSIKSLSIFGVASSITWQVMDDDSNSWAVIKPSLMAYRDAYQHRLPSDLFTYVGDKNGIIGALDGGNFVVSIDPKSKGFGGGDGHAISVVAYWEHDNHYWFLIKNSWGRDYGFGGYAWFDENDIELKYSFALNMDKFPKEWL